MDTCNSFYLKSFIIANKAFKRNVADDYHANHYTTWIHVNNFMYHIVSVPGLNNLGENIFTLQESSRLPMKITHKG